MTPASAAPGGARPDATPIKVMIVDDSVFMRGILKSWLGESGEFEIVAVHANGRRAADDVARSQPDLVILDLEMPDMDGLTALPLILERRAGASVLVASALSRRGAEISLRALSLGAADYIPKPEAAHGASGVDVFRRELLARARSLGQRARRRSSTRAATGGAAAGGGVAGATSSVSRQGGKLRPYSMMPVNILAIGSSTGGPQALTRLFADIGPNIRNIPVVVVQHMPATFTAILAEHIARAAGRPCAEGRDGEPLLPGRIYVAPGGLHMDVVRGASSMQLRLSDGPVVNFCKPAVDPMFKSVAGLYGGSTLAAVLTGMGSDGAEGALRIAETGGSVIAQDEESSVVWGMPGATVALGACAGILPIGEIGLRINRMLGARE
ncbi:chemotaxis response regulator protein-glutamate methylesterase [Ancylobacter dichloromethanicus]|uniref:Protein-glutamate methylesterase/protein-glutamine glutaminase n=2 Tax=Ancylobacter dichloromethanicus TaxID=518825 RepID=A0A9W6J3F1_9HYPH|nr:chemotaxis response regulator protein-glutamate methylesterase [Ancylobacter dichloromethanicus]MBS7556332.1 chemotaxis response regulator protein-glutamate methylesterase [Ancylobacter dichloromethanicus]GLK70096.1 chemotaxis response regulator protein-glutamate methylesterase 1 [Ancylobacter dichloromethanicus]